MTSTDPIHHDVDPTRRERSDVDRAKDAAHAQVWDALARELATEQPFRLLDLRRLRVPPDQAATHEVAMQIGQPVDVEEMQRIDLVVVGSVAVDRHGVRLGKGAGYADLEVALLAEAGLLTDTTTIVTTVHPLQVLDQDLPETQHDVRVDLLVSRVRDSRDTS